MSKPFIYSASPASGAPVCSWCGLTPFAYTEAGLSVLEHECRDKDGLAFRFTHRDLDTAILAWTVLARWEFEEAEA